MIKPISLGGLLALLAMGGAKDFYNYRPVESYEVEQGIFATPIYSPAGETCEIGLERRHYSRSVVNLDDALSREQITSTFDKLAPISARGRPASSPAEEMETTETDGAVTITRIPYPNVSLYMYKKTGAKAYVAAVVSWKTPECRKNAAPPS